MIKMTIARKIGHRSFHFQFEGKNLYEVVKESEKLSFPDIESCGLCKSSNLQLSSRHAQNKYKYAFIRCLDCKAQLVFGQTKEDEDAFYPRRNEKKELDWHIYDSNEVEKTT